MKPAILLVSVFFSILVASVGCKDKCADVSCLNGGECVEGICYCPPGFVGVNCQNTVYTGPCGTGCENGGTCNGGTCDCPPGYYGTNCENVSCDFIACLNGGTCNDGTCFCPPGYSGSNCEIVDACIDVNCLNDGTCVDGTCECEPGYEGDSCQTALSPFIGDYNVVESCSSVSGSNNYTLTVSYLSATEIRLSLGVLGIEADAVLNGNSFTIASQFQVVVTISGSGQFVGNQITVDYTLEDGNGSTNTCTATGPKL